MEPYLGRDDARSHRAAGQHPLWLSTKGLVALPQPGQVLVGPWGTRDMWGDVTAARMRAVGPGPAQGMGDGI